MNPCHCTVNYSFITVHLLYSSCSLSNHVQQSSFVSGRAKITFSREILRNVGKEGNRQRVMNYMSGSLISFRLLSISNVTCFSATTEVWRKSSSQLGVSIGRQTPEHNALTTEERRTRKSQECKCCRITAHKPNALENKDRRGIVLNCVALLLDSFLRQANRHLN